VYERSCWSDPSGPSLEIVTIVAGAKRQATLFAVFRLGQFMSDLLQDITECLDIGIVACDRNKRLRYWNSLGPKFLGAPAELFIRGRSLVEIFSFFAERGDYGPGEPRALAADRLNHIAQEAWAGPHSYFHIRSDANAVQVRVQRNANGDLVFQLSDVLGVQSILEGTVDAVIFADQLERIISFNRGAEIIFGWKSSEVVGRALEILIPARDREQHKAHMKAFAGSIARTQTMQGRSEIVGLTKAGEEFPAEASVAKIHTGGALLYAAIIRDISGRRKLEEAERQSEAALLQAQKLAKLGYYRWSKSRQKLIDFNDGYRDILGLPTAAQERARRGIAPFIHPDDRDRVLHAHRTAEDQGSAAQIEFRILRPDGAVHYLRDFNEPEPNSDGPPDTWFGTIQDITDLKEREEELRQSQAALDQAARMAKLAYFRWSRAENRYLQLSEQFFEILGIPVEHRIRAGDYIDPFLHPEDRDRLIRQRTAAENENQKFDLEYRIVRPDGELRHIHEIAEIKADLGESSDIYFGTLQDVTEQKRVESDLRESEERHRSVVAVLADGVILQDRDGVIRAANASAERILGLTADQILGRTSLDPRWRAIKEDGSPFPGDCHPGMVTLATGKPLRDVIMGVRKPDGATSWISVNSQPMFRPGETKCHAVVTSFTEITDKRRVEAEMRQSHKLQSVGTLAGGIAHELNNLLVPIIGLTELTIDTLPERGKSRTNLNNVLAAAERARLLVQNILAFSRRDTPNRQLVKIEPLIDEVMAMVRPVLPTTIDIRQRIERNTPDIPADAALIHQVLINLMSNAAAAMGLKGGLLEVTASGVDLTEVFCQTREGVVPGRYARIRVSDTGHGMDEETQRRIFEPFFTTKKTGDGTGMGLSVVHGIVSAHAGAIEVESKIGRGTAFTVYFPAFDPRAVKK
jgi:PAS domain S-box-containing protein